MPALTEGVYSGDWLKSEDEQGPGHRSREKVTILAGSGAARALTSGMVLGTITASGKVVQFDDTAADGSEDASGVLLYDASAPDGVDGVGVAIVRSAQVRELSLVWPGTADAGEKTAAVAQLKALGIIPEVGE